MTTNKIKQSVIFEVNERNFGCVCYSKTDKIVKVNPIKGIRTATKIRSHFVGGASRVDIWQDREIIFSGLLKFAYQKDVQLTFFIV